MNETATNDLQVEGAASRRWRSRWAPLLGSFEKNYQITPGFNMASGTSEVMRNLIASLGLGLPRSW